MADVLKKSTIKSADLPEVSPNNTYIVRYRIVSQDQNRYSHWSPIYNINAPAIDKDEIDGSITFSETTRQITVGWTNEAKGPYDVFYRLDGGAWQYLAKTSSTSYQYFVRSTTFGDFDFRIQVASYYKTEPSPLLEVFTGSVTVPADGIA